MPPNVPRSRRVGRPPRLSLEAIIDAATRILQDEGLERLSMRRLANELGSAPMALYHHVRDKDELLVQVMETQARDISRPALPTDPRERLIAASVLLYDLLAERPWIVEVLTSDSLIGPSALWIVEEMLDAAIDYGHSADEAHHVYRTIWSYIVGNLIIQVASSRRRARAGTAHQDEVIARLSADTHPRLATIADRWAELNARKTYRQALAAIIDGLLPAHSSMKPQRTGAHTAPVATTKRPDRRGDVDPSQVELFVSLCIPPYGNPAEFSVSWFPALRT
ncbi:TetR/AcrR family transcriptional regulator [Verrucosispora sp. WMMD573]|uniref:TetR/AcrR family transcriptional regulator n=1 Tax=Verrucosispora sp. WMMD573 TaxID=3015149 RepID=UPI00248C71B6|nr:TetR/AcrR family transcriptional regulator [Verrucosispora sp. WMMD573]WBB53401.1 helix-turn-helix domain containing protein [Verrucosispora sp. WMMD573]